MAEINGLLNRRTSLKMYRGFESLPHRKGSEISEPLLYMIYVYILFSENIQQYYCGQTNSVAYRLQQHNSGETLSNKHGIPWILIGYIEKVTRSEAIVLERRIKKRGISRWLKEHSNELIKNI